MQITSNFDELHNALDGRKSCLTIGVFDGVHLGHQSLVHRTIELARAKGLVSVVLTFSSHPLSVLAPPYTPRRLITKERKINLLDELGVEIVLMMEFTPEFAAIPPENFIRDHLVTKANLGHMVCGYDFTFGNRGAGNLALLQSLSNDLDFDAEDLPALTQEHRAVKSTHIRDLLFAGKLTDANNLLSRPHEVPGIVVSGRQQGRTIGFPTANLQLPSDYQIPAQGVYICAARVGMQETVFAAMVNIGTSPTFGNNPQTIEAYLLDFSADIHGQKLTLYFMDRLRNEKRFDSVQDLVAQLNLDREQTANLWKQANIQSNVLTLPKPVKHSLS